MTRQFKFTRHTLLLGAALCMVLLLLFIELQSVLPLTLERWSAYDYARYVEIGRALRENPYSYGQRAMDSVYPLPAELWLFIPLSFLPDWFRLIWILLPIVSLIVLFRRDGFLWIAYPPLWFVISDGTIDGLLLLPLRWLIENRPVLAPVGALLVLVKPQLVALPLAYMLVHWFVTRDWKNLGIFLGGAIVFSLPAFVLDPLWLAQMVQSLPARSNQMQSSIAPQSSSLWGWLNFGIVGVILCAVFVALMLWLLWWIWRQCEKRAAGFALADLLSFWVLYASSLVLVPAVVRERQSILVVVLLGLVCEAANYFFNLGALFSIVPLVALYLLSRTQPLPFWRASSADLTRRSLTV